jgi:hypothetical protein
MTRGDNYVTHFDRRRLIGNDHWGVCGGLAVSAPVVRLTATSSRVEAPSTRYSRMSLLNCRITLDDQERQMFEG